MEQREPAPSTLDECVPFSSLIVHGQCNITKQLLLIEFIPNNRRFTERWREKLCRNFQIVATHHVLIVSSCSCLSFSCVNNSSFCVLLLWPQHWFGWSPRFSLLLVHCTDAYSIRNRLFVNNIPISILYHTSSNHWSV